jgi:hypothetical protein
MSVALPFRGGGATRALQQDRLDGARVTMKLVSGAEGGDAAGRGLFAEPSHRQSQPAGDDV